MDHNWLNVSAEQCFCMGRDHLKITYVVLMFRNQVGLDYGGQFLRPVVFLITICLLELAFCVIDCKMPEEIRTIPSVPCSTNECSNGRPPFKRIQNQFFTFFHYTGPHTPCESLRKAG